MLTRQVRRWPDHPVLAYRPETGGYRPISWGTFMGDVASVATFLYGKGIRKADRVAIFSPNSYNMLVWEMTVTSMGAQSVPIFAGYDAKNVDFILRHAEPKAIYIDGLGRLEKVEMSSAADSIPTIVTAQESKRSPFTECLSGGDPALYASLVKAVKPDDVCFIQYTSGTTGNPKGVMLTHRNIMSQRKGMSQVWQIPYKSRFLSYLPWHHSFGGLFERFAALYHGATIYMEDSFGKDIKRLLQNWADAESDHVFQRPGKFISRLSQRLARAAKFAAFIFHPELKFSAHRRGAASERLR